MELNQETQTKLVRIIYPGKLDRGRQAALNGI